MDSAGNFYGATIYGGDYDIGAVFEVAPDGTETVLHTFDLTDDGGNPSAGVILDRDGNLYGTAHGGPCGGKDGEPVYRLSPDGSIKLVCVHGRLESGLVERNGFLYGTATYGYEPQNYPGLVFSVKK